MKVKNIFKLVLIVLIIAFTFLFIASQSGYYEYELSRKTKLTEESIARFEEDIASGKNVDINDYVVSKEKNYNNMVSNLGSSISSKLETAFSKGFEIIFKYINNQMET